MIGNQENIISSVTVEKSEVLRYLGHNGQEIDNDLKIVDTTIREYYELGKVGK